MSQPVLVPVMGAQATSVWIEMPASMERISAGHCLREGRDSGSSKMNEWTSLQSCKTCFQELTSRKIRRDIQTEILWSYNGKCLEMIQVRLCVSFCWRFLGKRNDGIINHTWKMSDCVCKDKKKKSGEMVESGIKVKCLFVCVLFWYSNVERGECITIHLRFMVFTTVPVRCKGWTDTFLNVWFPLWSVEEEVWSRGGRVTGVGQLVKIGIHLTSMSAMCSDMPSHLACLTVELSFVCYNRKMTQNHFWCPGQECAADYLLQFNYASVTHGASEQCQCQWQPVLS